MSDTSEEVTSQDTSGDVTSQDTSAIFDQPQSGEPTVAPALHPEGTGTYGPVTRKSGVLVKRRLADHPPGSSPENKVVLNAKTKSGLNVAAAFVMFCRGMSLQEIAAEFGTPLDKLSQRARSEDWNGLAAKSAAIVAPPPGAEMITVSAADTEKKMLRIEANREKAFSVSEILRAKIVDSLKQIDERTDALAVAFRDFLARLEAGTIEDSEQIEAFLERMEALDVKRVADILALAKAARLVDESSMTALGDVIQKGGNAGGSSNTPQLIINLPGVAAQPRMLKAVAPFELPPAEAPEENTSRVTKPLQFPISGGLSERSLGVQSVATDVTTPIEKIEAAIVGPKASGVAVKVESGVGHGIDFNAL